MLLDFLISDVNSYVAAGFATAVVNRDGPAQPGGEKPPLVVKRVFCIPLRKAVYIIKVLKVEPGT